GTPLFLVWNRLPRGWFGRERLMETTCFFLTAFFAGQAIFLGWFDAIFGPLAFGYWMFLFVVLAALRFGRHGVVLVIAMVAIQALLGAERGVGYFGADVAQTGLENFWCYLLVLTVTGIALALSFHVRKQAEDSQRIIEERLRVSQCYGGVGVWENDLVSNRQYWSEAVTTILGFPQAGQLAWESFIAAVHPDDRRLVTEAHRAHIEDGRPYDVDYRIVDRDGKTRWMRSAGRAERDADGKPVRMRGIVQDITSRKQAEESLRLATLAYDNSSEAMVVTDAGGTILTVNPAFTRTTGYAAEEAIGQNPRILSSGRHDGGFYRAMWESINTSGRWQGEIWNRRKDGEIYIEQLSINTIFNEDGAPWRRVAQFLDITQKKASEEQLWKQANFDNLTGLPNRRMFHDRLEQEIKKSHRANLPLGLLFLDLDRFKEVNDTLGHEAGDLLLQHAAQRLVGCVRDTDTVARLGGDEFTIILGELDSPENLERIARSILDGLAEPFHLGGELAFVSASIGITLYPADASDVEQLVKNADQAMYAAKHQGRNRYSYFTPSMQDAAQKRLRLANDMRYALAGQQFQVHYQPIVELASGAVYKAEALIRWNHPSRGLVSPAEFIPIAEDSGLINEIGDWVFRTAVQQVGRWRAMHHAAFQVGINKSPIQFKSPNGTHAAWGAHLQTLGLPGESLVVEITEGLLMDATGVADDKLLELRDAGIQVAIDDFGTGYSSLAYLKKFHIDYLKIDQSFTRNLAPDSNDLALCEAIIVMAHKLGLKVIAEGVETAAQRDLLVATGCDYAQGYLFARPMPPEMFDAWMKGQNA
ncbi:MAG TPA: EAL domain-containing protein, partial [Methylococcaceae bacterium]|nr:EAL domain-containing protein [Methylococcaceae bacterium]